MKMSAKFEVKNETFGASFEQTDSTFDANFSNVGGGQDGKDGATFIPSVSEEGVISWTNNGNLPNPTPVNIKGEKGVDGKDGANGIDGKDGHTPVITIQNGYWYVDGVNTQVKAEGVDGKDGVNGKDGIDGQNGKDGADGKDGENGKDGTNGKDGASITVISVTESTEDNGSNVVTFSDGNTLTVKNGSKGSQGEKGDQGERGEKGEQGIQGMQGVQGIQGEQGPQGEQGIQGEKGADGANGKDGTNGKDGVSATHSWNGTTLTITSASGTSSADLKGDKGEKGDKGDKGDTGEQGPQGDKGDSYTLTEADKEEIAEQAAEKVDTSNLATVDKVGTIDTWYDAPSIIGARPDGIVWTDQFAFLGGNNDEEELKVGSITQLVPIVAGENVEFEVDEENQVVKINVPAIGDISSALDELHAYAQALIGGGA